MALWVAKSSGVPGAGGFEEEEECDAMENPQIELMGGHIQSALALQCLSFVAVEMDMTHRLMKTVLPFSGEEK